jgi:serine/threonine protein phosphatase PrpC
VYSDPFPLFLLPVQRDSNDPNQFTLTAANVGDARVVVGHADGRVQRMTHDHRVDDPLEIARIQKAGGFVFRGRVMGVLAITRSIGDSMVKPYVIAHPHVETTQVSSSSVCIVACDGLWDVMSDEEAVRFVREYKGDPSNVASSLVQESLKKGTTDNVTAIVAWM